MLATCRRSGIGFVAYSPLGRGFRTDEAPTRQAAAGDFRSRAPRFVGEAFERNLALVRNVQTIAAARVSVAQLALAWVLLGAEDVVPIPGTKRRRWLRENIARCNHAERGRCRGPRGGGATRRGRWRSLAPTSMANLDG